MINQSCITQGEIKSNLEACPRTGQMPKNSEPTSNLHCCISIHLFLLLYDFVIRVKFSWAYVMSSFLLSLQGEYLWCLGLGVVTSAGYRCSSSSSWKGSSSSLWSMEEKQADCSTLLQMKSSQAKTGNATTHSVQNLDAAGTEETLKYFDPIPHNTHTSKSLRVFLSSFYFKILITIDMRQIYPTSNFKVMTCFNWGNTF